MNRAYRVFSKEKEIGRVLGLSADDALTRAKACWPKARHVTVKLYVKKSEERALPQVVRRKVAK